MAVEADLLKSIGGREAKALAQAAAFDTLLIGAPLLKDPNSSVHMIHIVRIMGSVTLVVHYTETSTSESAANAVTYLVSTGNTWRTKA